MAHKLEVAWSASALEDLLQVLDRIATDNRAAAEKFAAAVERKTQQLASPQDSGLPIRGRDEHAAAFALYRATEHVPCRKLMEYPREDGVLRRHESLVRIQAYN